VQINHQTEREDKTIKMLMGPGILVATIMALTACSGSSGHTVAGAPGGDSAYRDALYTGCQSVQDRTNSDGTVTSEGDCRCMTDLFADDAGSYKAVSDELAAGTLGTATFDKTFALTHLTQVTACASK
jgi:hypothetical protein